MTTTPTSSHTVPSRAQRRMSVWMLRTIGWTLVGAGAVVLLYVAYALWFTGFETERAQQALQQEWRREMSAPAPGADAPQGGGEVDAGSSTAGPPQAASTGDPVELEDGVEAVAMMEFVRPGDGPTPVRDEPLFVVDGVSYEDLTKGPGHYPGTELPGRAGNFAVAGHRTTYDAPFYDLNELRRGDEIHVTDRTGAEHVYEFVERRIVEPTAGWVLRDDPLETGEPTLTLTTCHPRFSAAQRMIVFAELAG